jgi:membrane fusion protein, heavy metal efflux system
MLAALVALVLVLAVALALRPRGEAHSAPSAGPDMPHIEHELIRFSDSWAKRSGIVFEQVKIADLVPVVSAVGTAELNAEHVAAIGVRLRGLVSRVNKFEGDLVEVGTPLARLESAELGEAQATVGMLDAQREAAELNANRELSLADRHLTTAREVETASMEARKAKLLLGAARQKVAALGGSGQLAKGGLGWHEMRSPIQGTVVERNVAPGQFVEGNVVAFKIANLDHLWIELDVFERNLDRIRVGDHAELTPLAGGFEPRQGRVAKVGSQIDSESHSAKVRIEVENRDHRLRVGQAVKARIHSSGGPATARPTVRSRALTFVDGKPTVFVRAGPTSVRVVSVLPGDSDGDYTEILEGVSGADQIVTDGAFTLKSELFR